MAILYEQLLPDGVTLAFTNEVRSETGLDTDPPAGLIVHTIHQQGDRVRVVDVWESQEALDRFNQRLMQAVQRVAERHGMPMVPESAPDPKITDLAQIVRG